MTAPQVTQKFKSGGKSGWWVGGTTVQSQCTVDACSKKRGRHAGLQAGKLRGSCVFCCRVPRPLPEKKKKNEKENTPVTVGRGNQWTCGSPNGLPHRRNLQCHRSSAAAGCCSDAPSRPAYSPSGSAAALKPVTCPRGLQASSLASSLASAGCLFLFLFTKGAATVATRPSAFCGTLGWRGGGPGRSPAGCRSLCPQCPPAPLVSGRRSAV